MGEDRKGKGRGGRRRQGDGKKRKGMKVKWKRKEMGEVPYQYFFSFTSSPVSDCINELLKRKKRNRKRNQT